MIVDKDSKIVSLNGGPLPEPGQVNPRMVEVLEAALERAKAGNSAGIVLIEINHELSCRYWITGYSLATFPALGALAAVQHDLARDIVDERE